MVIRNLLEQNPESLRKWKLVPDRSTKKKNTYCPSGFQRVFINLEYTIASTVSWNNHSFLLRVCLSVCNFQSMKSPVELNSLLSKFFCYITWFVISPDQTRLWTTCKRGLYVKSYCLFETIAQWIKNYKLYKILTKI